MKRIEWPFGAAITYDLASGRPRLLRAAESEPATGTLLAKGMFSFQDFRIVELFAFGDKVFLSLGPNEEGLFGAAFWTFPANAIAEDGSFDPFAPYSMTADQVHSVVSRLTLAAGSRLDHHPVKGRLPEMPPLSDAQNENEASVLEAVHEALRSSEIREKLSDLGHRMKWDIYWFDYSELGTCVNCGMSATVALSKSAAHDAKGHALKYPCTAKST